MVGIVISLLIVLIILVLIVLVKLCLLDGTIQEFYSYFSDDLDISISDELDARIKEATKKKI